VAPSRNEAAVLYFECDAVATWVGETLHPSLEDALGLRDAKTDLKVQAVRGARKGNRSGDVGYRGGWEEVA
jgi:hypothetical protein